MRGKLDTQLISGGADELSSGVACQVCKGFCRKVSRGDPRGRERLQSLTRGLHSREARSAEPQRCILSYLPLHRRYEVGLVEPALVVYPVVEQLDLYVVWNTALMLRSSSHVAHYDEESRVRYTVENSASSRFLSVVAVERLRYLWYA